jgi:hypothetical protein
VRLNMREEGGRKWQRVSIRNGRHGHLSSRYRWRCRAPSPLGRGAGSLWLSSVSEWEGGGVVWAKRNGRRREVLAL